VKLHVCDAMYVVLAVRLKTRLITGDDRLETAVRNVTAVAGHIQLVQTFEPDLREGQVQDLRSLRVLSLVIRKKSVGPGHRPNARSQPIRGTRASPFTKQY